MPNFDENKTFDNYKAEEIARDIRQHFTNSSNKIELNRAIKEGESVAKIIEPLGLPSKIMTSAIIYPLFREKILKIKDIENIYLHDISKYILGLDQLNQFSLPHNWKPGESLAIQQSEALRKMLLAVVSDVRLVLVRIAEQLYRLREAKNATDSVKLSLSIETREIYAALANRLGVWQLKWELEDYAFRYSDPDSYLKIAKLLKEKRIEREGFIDKLKNSLRIELETNGIIAKVSGRPKHIYSIWRKMHLKNRGLQSLYDIRAVRILVQDVNECYAALGIVHNMWPYIPGEFDDYIANPKENSYQSLHTAVIGPDGKTIEVQIRSHDMHQHAEIGVAAHWLYKEGTHSDSTSNQKIRFLRQLLEPTNNDEDLLGQIKDNFFEDRVYAISPKGDVVELSKNATPLDFAYHVHTQVGHRCRGAKINGRIVPLTKHICNGDQIEILTGKHPQPSRDWLSPKLGYLASAKARTKVRNWFRQQDKSQHVKQGKDILDRELSRLSERDFSIDKIASILKQKDTESLFVSLGAGDLTSASIATALQKIRGNEVPKFLNKKQSKRKNKNSQSISLTGVGNLLCNFARCCSPVPPEPIVGYITQGRGVSVHKQDCGNFLSLNKRSPERVLEINWGDSDFESYPVNLTVHAFDRAGLIRDITSVLADDGANVLDLKTFNDKKLMQVKMDFRIEIIDLPTLSAVIKKLEQLPNIVLAKRKI
ncbi:MAG: GTP diphosphokinase [Woeseia sp.]|nr:GTP diphosphokinase [Woeseia sp.]|tara:strand:- start:4378 stop:6507 length:2130 start_codon:yes stop_codon:yes gene_type:complete